MSKNYKKIYLFIVFFYIFFIFIYAQEFNQEEFTYKEKIFYVFEDSRNLFQIASMDLNGENKEILTKEGNNWSPSISPDGSLIAFFSDRTGFVNLWVMSSNGKNQKQLTFEENSQNKIDLFNRGKIAWLKDNFILFILNDDIWQVDPDGNNPFNITSTHDVTMFKLSPDKTKILFSREKTKNNNGLWVMLIDGRGLTQIEKSFIKYPAFDWITNEKIVYYDNTKIISSLSNGTDRKKIKHVFYLFNDLEWSSPEKTEGTLAFISDEKDGPNIWTINLDGSNLKQITKKNGFSPFWYKDASILFFVENNNIHSYNFLTNEKKQLSFHFQTYFPVFAEISIKKGITGENK